MDIQELPMFNELSIVLHNYKIESWHAGSFWAKVKLLNVESTNVNYQNVYRLILRLVKEKYLAIDMRVTRSAVRTYSETKKMEDFRIIFCDVLTPTIQALITKKKELESQIIVIRAEIEALEDLKGYFPNIVLRIEQLKQLKIKEIDMLNAKNNALNSLIHYL